MIEISDIKKLQDILDNAEKGTLLIFKHSTRCPVSSHAKKELEKFLENNPKYKENTFLIKVIESRELSNYITETTGIEHQSPQLLIMKDGKVLIHLSHFQITVKSIESALQQ